MKLRSSSKGVKSLTKIRPVPPKRNKQANTVFANYRAFSKKRDKKTKKAQKDRKLKLKAIFRRVKVWVSIGQKRQAGREFALKVVRDFDPELAERILSVQKYVKDEMREARDQNRRAQNYLREAMEIRMNRILLQNQGN